jgi:hypothetical protein
MFKKFKKHIDETFAYVKDPFKEGDAIWVKKVKIDGVSVIQIVSQVDGIKGMHIALISIRTTSLDTFGEDSLKQRLIIHQKDFSYKRRSDKALEEIKKQTSYV